MKEFIVTEIEKEIALRGRSQSSHALGFGDYTFSFGDSIIAEAKASEAHVLSNAGMRILIVEGRNGIDDLDFVLGKLPQDIDLDIQKKGSPDDHIIMRVLGFGAVVKLMGSPVGEPTPGEELQGTLLISDRLAGVINCFEPEVLGEHPYLQMESSDPAVSLISEGLSRGRKVRLQFEVSGDL